MTYCSAMATLDPADLVDLYWAGRTTLVTRRDQIPVYDRVFRRFFLDEHEALPEPWKSTLPPAADSQAVLEVPATEPGCDGEDDREARLGLVASDIEIFRNKVLRRVHPRRARRPASHHRPHPAGAASASQPALDDRAVRAPPRPPPDGPRDDAHAR